MVQDNTKLLAVLALVYPSDPPPAKAALLHIAAYTHELNNDPKTALKLLTIIA